MKYLVISDIHANLTALKAVLEDCGSWDKVIFLGDVVDYGPDPNGCIDALKRLNGHMLVGNHDLVITGNLPASHMNYHARSCSYWTQDVIRDKHVEWLKLFEPEKIKDEFYLVHGRPDEPALGYFDSTGRADKVFSTYSFPVLFHGHSHVPILFVEGEGYAMSTDLENTIVDTNKKRCIINPGSVGQPRDGDNRASYGIWEDGIFLWKRVEYDIPSVQKKIKEAGLPEFEAERLMYGE